MNRSKNAWEEFVKGETLFSNAIRLRYFIWTIQRHIAPDSRVLEVGFGSGKTAVLMADMGYKVTAMDINEILVKRMHKRYEKCYSNEQLRFQQADMLALPWDKQAFDLAYHQGVLEHFPDENIVQALKEQSRVSDLVIFDIPNKRYKDRPFGDERLLPAAHWRRLIQEAGLEVLNELGRGYHSWHYILPMAFFSKTGMQRLPWFSRLMGTVSIFVCKSRRG